jgi:hypothetical protein
MSPRKTKEKMTTVLQRPRELPEALHLSALRLFARALATAFWPIALFVVSWRTMRDRILFHVFHELRRLFIGKDPELWLEYVSSTVLVLTALWFAIGGGPNAKAGLSRIMPIAVWILAAAAVGLVQGFSAACKDWRTRASGDALAALYWAITSLLLFAGGFTALHPHSLTLAAFNSMVVCRYFWRSERRHGPETP